jgi:hypothetical protein
MMADQLVALVAAEENIVLTKSVIRTRILFCAAA